MVLSATETRQAGDVVAAAAGDRAAYGRLVDGTRNLVCSISLGIVRDVAASEDVAQEVYLAAWQDLGKLRNPASFLPWLRQLTRNRAHDVVRKQIRVRQRSAAGDTAALVDPRPDAGAQLVAREEQAALVEALTQLPEAAREVVTLFYREGRSTVQVAELLGISEAAVKKRLQRAREDLRAATLQRLGESLERSAPAAAFTSTVLAALVTGAPGTAAAAKIGLTATATSVGGKLAAGIVGGALGPLLGVLGVAGGVWLVMRRATDEQERRALRAFGALNSLLMLIFAALVPPSARILHGYGILAWFGVAYSTIGYNFMVRLPRISAPREARERAEDPLAAARQRRERRRRVIGCVLGGVCSLGTIVWMLWLTHHAR
ncbi:MAG TPA: sigma-70 family RNA polymerase sigma factor [Polyangia bacterium]|nr:sigma-70 family RNA polymerase sigma factor [Polyangia bacterium]